MSMHTVQAPESLLADYRMIFLKQVRRYLDTGDLSWREVSSHYVSLQLLCWHLWDDDHVLPAQFTYLARAVCHHEFATWSRRGGTYGAIARAVGAHVDHYLKQPNGHPRAPLGFWVNNALRADKPDTDWLLLQEEIERLSADAA